MESIVAIFGFGFFGGCVVSGWVAFFTWKRFTNGVTRRLAMEAARKTGSFGEPNSTQRLDMRQIGALLAQAHPVATPTERSTRTEVVVPKRVITPNRKISAIRPGTEVENTTKNSQKECIEEGELQLDPA